MNLTIGSGDISSLMAGKHTKTYQDLLRKFVAEHKPYYNALASPIDALRTGAILEDRYLLTLPDNYFSQYKARFEEMNIFTSSIDFAKIESGEIVDFDELKTINITDFWDIIQPLKEVNDYTFIIKSRFKKYYEQVQCQLMCTGLYSCNLVFLAVTSYDDEENKIRFIQENELATFRIYRDESVISEIKKRGQIFQLIKDHL